MFRVLILGAGLFLSVLYGYGQDELTGYLCHGSLPLQSPAEVPLDFPWLYFDSTAPDSGGGVLVLNKSDKEIEYYLIIIEFLNDQGKYLISLPVYNVNEKDQSIPLDVPFKPWVLSNWPGSYMGSIGPRSQSEKVFRTPLSMLTCPASARVTAVHLKYKDGAEFNYTSPSLNLSTTPTNPLDINDKKGAERWAPVTVSGTLQVDEKGHVRIVNLDFAAPGFRTWLQNEFIHWNFSAAWVEGKPATTTLPFLVILGDTTDTIVQVQALRRKGERGPLFIWPAIN